MSVWLGLRDGFCSGDHVMVATIRHPDGITLAGPTFRRDYKSPVSHRPREQQKIDAILATIPDHWTYAINILRLAKLPNDKSCYRVIRDLASRKMIEARVFAVGAGTQTKYRRKGSVD